LAGAGIDQDSDIPMKGPSDDTESVPSPAVYYNLAVKHKAVYQLIFKLWRWLKEQKRKVPLGAVESISDIESRLPPLRGGDANINNYATELGNVEEQLNAFYNTDMSVKKHQWGARKVLDVEFAIITHRLLKMVGGAAGRP